MSALRWGRTTEDTPSSTTASALLYMVAWCGPGRREQTLGSLPRFWNDTGHLFPVLAGGAHNSLSGCKEWGRRRKPTCTESLALGEVSFLFICSFYRY